MIKLSQVIKRNNLIKIYPKDVIAFSVRPVTHVATPNTNVNKPMLA